MAESRDPTLIERFAALVPKELEGRSGKVFYAGRAAFGAPCPIYLLGLNPGGHEEDHPDETIGEHTRRVLHEYPDDWTAILDETWRPHGFAYPPGEAPLQHELRTFLDGLGLDLRRVPMSNVTFVRSTSSDTLGKEGRATIDLCRAFHLAVIHQLQVRLVVCMGKEPGMRLVKWFGAQEIGRYPSENGRRWMATVWGSSENNPKIVILRYPSRGCTWMNPEENPAPFVRSLIDIT